MLKGAFNETPSGQRYGRSLMPHITFVLAVYRSRELPTIKVALTSPVYYTRTKKQTDLYHFAQRALPLWEYVSISWLCEPFTTCSGRDYTVKYEFLRVVRCQINFAGNGRSLQRRNIYRSLWLYIRTLVCARTTWQRHCTKIHITFGIRKKFLSFFSKASSN